MQAVALRKLRMLHNARRLGDLAAFPGSRLEALKGSRRGQWSIRINDRWRICFRRRENDAHQQWVNHGGAWFFFNHGWTRINTDLGIICVHPCPSEVEIPPQTTVRLLIRGRRGVSAELALRVARYAGPTAEFWIGLQGQHDLDAAQDETEERIAKEVRCPLLPAAG